MPNNTPLFIRLFRLSHVIDRQTLAIKRKMAKTGWSIGLQRRFDSLQRRKQVIEYYKIKMK